MADLNIIGNARCNFLTCKEMFMEVEGSEPFHSGSGSYWCALTQTAIGPDGQFVDDQACNSGRGCFSGV